VNSRLQLQDIRWVWESIKPAIVELKDKWQFDWRPEDVYAQCLIGKAFCYTCDDGFVIVKPMENQYTLAKELFVWVCYSEAKDGITEYYTDICAIAKEVYATTLIFESPREGFKRVAKANHWQTMTTYKLRVT
jgi:hypothetical protein